MTTADIFLLINVGIRLWVAISLTRTWRQNKMQNLLWLAILFYSNSIFNLFALTSLNVSYSIFNVKVVPLAIPFPFRIGAAIQQIALVMFIVQTFYQGRTSPFKFFMSLTVVISVGVLLLTIPIMADPTLARYDTISYSAFVIVALVNRGWHTWAAWRGYSAISGDTYVEDWVKSRYRLMIASGIFALLASGSTRLVDIFGPSALILAASVAIITSILQFLVWVLPEGFRLWLNRNYRQPVVAKDVAEMSEDELLRQLKGHTPILAAASASKN